MSAIGGVFRATFNSPYRVTKSHRNAKANCPRLGDHLVHFVDIEATDYFREILPGEFSVVDLANRQKAWFEAPSGATPEQIHSMIEGHFKSKAFRIAAFLWAVQC
jgi:hypothetical protein